MLIQTILNKCYKFKSFVYGDCCFDKTNKNTLITTIHPRKNSKAICSGCNKPAPLYDKMQKKRDFEFMPIWGFNIILRYLMRRTDCRRCGVKIEKVPWARGKNTCTTAFTLFLANWAKSLSWKETAHRFGVSWEKVFLSVKYVVEWGLEHRNLNNILSIGIDEIAWRSGHKYLTLVYQIDEGSKRLLWIGRDRTTKTLLRFFIKFGKDNCNNLKFVCSDMWKPYLKVIKKKAVNAINILDRFHIIKKLNKAIDEVRAEEHKQLKEDGYDSILTNARWCLLKRKENLTDKQDIKLKDVLKYNLKSVRSYLLKGDFDQLWRYKSTTWAGKFIDKWTTRVMRSQIKPMKKIAKMIRKHKLLILNWFKADGRLSSGVVEGLNNKVKVTMRKSYGFRTYNCIEIALYHTLGHLPEPELTHRFY